MVCVDRGPLRCQSPHTSKYYYALSFILDFERDVRFHVDLAKTL
jgi:hypothetical protein